MLLILPLLVIISGCKDIVFNNPLDPDASRDVLQIIRVLDTPLGGKGDIAFDGEKFWKINPYGNLTAFDQESGTIIRTFYTSPGTGVVFFRDEIYLCNESGENVLMVTDPLSGDTNNRISMRDLFPAYLTSVDQTLLIYDARSGGLFQYNPDSGDAVQLFDLSGIDIGGIALYKGDLLITDKNTDSLYRYSLDGNVQDVFSSPAAGISGVAVDNSDYVYLIMMDGKIYKVSLP